MVKQHIIDQLNKVISALTDQAVTPHVDVPSLSEHGDYTTNIALALSKKIRKSPMEIAKEIASSVERLAVSEIERVEVAGPGFINFWVSKEYLAKVAEKTLQEKETFGSGDLMKDEKVMVEFTDPNPFKEFHIGHLYSNIVGESLSRLFASQAAIVRRVCYQGDVGLHVAKAIFGLIQKLQSTDDGLPSTVDSRQWTVDDLSDLEKKSLEERIKFLGEAYALGATKYEEDEEAKKEINALNKKIYAKDPSILDLYEKGRAWSLEYFEKIYERLGTKFTGYYFESKAGPIGVELVKKHLQDGVFVEDQGAIIFRGEDHGVHTRVFINSLGLPTYEAKELGLAPTKYNDFPYDLSVIVTGNEINDYFKVLLKALQLINPDLAAKTKHISHGMVKLPSGKMSSRSGNVLTGEWMVDEAKSKIKEKFPDISQEIAEMVAVGAVKYALLKSHVGKDIEFDFQASISLEGNSGPYIQYTYARTQSVLAKAKSTDDSLQTTVDSRQGTVDLPEEAIAVLRIMQRFDEVVADATANYAPSTIATYLYTLATTFNYFYQKVPILDSEQKESLLALTAATGQVLKNGLHLLGIKAPQRM